MSDITLYSLSDYNAGKLIPHTFDLWTIPPNTCEDGMGAAATVFNIAIPVEPLRQE